MIFDLSKSSIPESNRIWVIWAIKKNTAGAPENVFHEFHKTVNLISHFRMFKITLGFVFSCPCIIIS